MTASLANYPLVFEPIYKEKIWGGRAFEILGRKLPGSGATLIGESWEIADLAKTSVSGGGGEAALSVIRNGKLAGKTLHELISHNQKSVLGDSPVSEDGGFPLLIKYLDARQNLSVQVHPSKEYAAKHPEAKIKNEAWYVVDAEPGAIIYKGIKKGVTAQQFKNAIAQNKIEPILNKIEAIPGDLHYLSSGICHALGAGVLVAEVQTPSDTTFRVYDWGRTDRQLHIEQALECIDFEKNSNEQNAANNSDNIHCSSFNIDCYSDGDIPKLINTNNKPVILMCVKGSLQIVPGKNGAEVYNFAAGNTILLPAALNDIKANPTKKTTILKVTLP